MLLPNLNHKILFWSPFGSKNYNLNDSTSDNDSLILNIIKYNLINDKIK
jgi:hypothetical protein